MLLEGKNAIIYGGGGAIGGAVARAFANEGAHVYLGGRTLAKLEDVARDIRAVGGGAETAELDALDALDEAAVDEHADAVDRGNRQPHMRLARRLTFGLIRPLASLALLIRSSGCRASECFVLPECYVPNSPEGNTRLAANTRTDG